MISSLGAHTSRTVSPQIPSQLYRSLTDASTTYTPKALIHADVRRNDVSNNVLVLPNGDQDQCSDTPLQPDNTPQLVNCTGAPKNTLVSGDYSLLIISNNGNGDPIAYQRDFSLSVGPQQTSTVTPTLTVSNGITPIVNQTSTISSTTVTTIPSSTTTVANGPTITKIPAASRVVSTRGLLTRTQNVQSWLVSSTVKTVAASCVTPTNNRLPDPIASILPTVLGQLDSSIQNIITNSNNAVVDTLGGLIGLFPLKKRDELTASAKFKREIIEGRTPDAELKAAFVKERKARSQKIQKRAPDQPTITVTATTGISTVTIGSTAATSTQTITTTVIITSTVTSGVATVGNGQTGVQVVTAPAKTNTITVLVPIAVTTKTQTKTTTYVQPSPASELH